MPRIHFFPLNKEIDVEEGVSLYEAAQRAHVPVASSCDANLVCGKCHMKILEGAEGLSPLSEAELKVLKKEKVEEGARLSCQARVSKDCKVTTRYW